MASVKEINLLKQGIPEVAASIGCSCHIITSLPSPSVSEDSSLWKEFLTCIKNPLNSPSVYSSLGAALCVTAERYNHPSCNKALASAGWQHIATISSSHNQDSTGTPTSVMLWIKHNPGRARLPHKTLTPSKKP